MDAKKVPRLANSEVSTSSSEGVIAAQKRLAELGFAAEVASVKRERELGDVAAEGTLVATGIPAGETADSGPSDGAERGVLTTEGEPVDAAQHARLLDAREYVASTFITAPAPPVIEGIHDQPSA